MGQSLDLDSMEVVEIEDRTPESLTARPEAMSVDAGRTKEVRYGVMC